MLILFNLTHLIVMICEKFSSYFLIFLLLIIVTYYLFAMFPHSIVIADDDEIGSKTRVFILQYVEKLLELGRSEAMILFYH